MTVGRIALLHDLWADDLCVDLMAALQHCAGQRATDFVDGLDVTS
jgi:hypothetical protein